MKVKKGGSKGRGEGLKERRGFKGGFKGGRAGQTGARGVQKGGGGLKKEGGRGFKGGGFKGGGLGMRFKRGEGVRPDPPPRDRPLSRTAAGASHDSPRTPNMHISGSRRFKHHQNSTKGPQKERRKKIVVRRGKKRAKFWAVRRKGVPAHATCFGQHRFRPIPLQAKPWGPAKSWTHPRKS